MHRGQQISRHPGLLEMVDDPDVVGITRLPAEADPPLTVDADAVLAGAVTAEPFESVAGWHAQIVDAGRGVQHPQLAQGGLLHVGPESADVATLGDLFGVAVAVTLDPGLW
jgi:hypothetical protein